MRPRPHSGPAQGPLLGLLSAKTSKPRPRPYCDHRQGRGLAKNTGGGVSRFGSLCSSTWTVQPAWPNSEIWINHHSRLASQQTKDSSGFYLDKDVIHANKLLPTKLACSFICSCGTSRPYVNPSSRSSPKYALCLKNHLYESRMSQSRA